MKGEVRIDAHPDSDRHVHLRGDILDAPQLFNTVRHQHSLMYCPRYVRPRLSG